MVESFAELLEQNLAGLTMRSGAIVKATVVDIENDYVIVNAGLKSEGIIPRDEFLNDQGEVNIAIGDEVEVAIDTPEDGFGEAILSRKKAKALEAWRSLEAAYKAGENLMGRITRKVKGGFTVEINNIRAFLPGSLVDVRPVRDLSYLEGKELEFKVIKMDQKRNNIVVSRRAVVQAENSAERQSLLENLEEGQETTGVVKNLTDYGAFIDLGGIDGLLHITDISWKRVKHPNEVLAVGQEIKVKILRFDRERNRVSLGMKQLGDDPWADLTQRYPEGKSLHGKVTNITDYGCFVEIEEGVEGLVHMSEMDWTNKNEEAVKQYKKGQEVEAIILAIDPERERISLGIKQLTGDPFNIFTEQNGKGSIVTGKVVEVDAKGAVVELTENVQGTLRAAEIAKEKVDDARSVLKVGDEVEAKITTLDKKNRAISLSIKAKDAHEEAEAVKQYSRDKDDESSKTTLGDLLKEQIEGKEEGDEPAAAPEEEQEKEQS